MDFSLSQKDSAAIKGIAICAMLFHHLFYLHPEYGVLTHQLGLMGKVCVALFLFVSGYGLCFQFTSKMDECAACCDMGGVTLRFLLRRFIKFYLNYWVIFLLFVPLGIFVFDRSLQTSYGEESNVAVCIIKEFLGLNGFQSYNATWWFNKLILTLYLLFPLLFLYTRNKCLSLATLAITFIKFNNFFPFVMGMCFATNTDLFNKLLQRIHPLLITVVPIIITAGLFYVRQKSSIPYTNGTCLDGIISLFMAMAVVSLRCCIKTGYKLLGYLGKHSMNIYLLHTFIFLYFFPDFCYSFKNPALIFLSLLLSTLLISILIEKIKTFCKFYQLQSYLLSKTK